MNLFLNYLLCIFFTVSTPEILLETPFSYTVERTKKSLDQYHRSLSPDFPIPPGLAVFSQVLQKPEDDTQPTDKIILDGYQVGMTALGIASSWKERHKYPHLDPGAAPYYTNLYRWSLRYLSTIPYWLSGNDMSYPDTHKVWKRRFHYMDEFVPTWLRKVLPFINEDEWKQEEEEYQRYIESVEGLAFGVYYKYPDRDR